MGEIAVRTEKLSKHYRVGPPRPRHDTLRDHLVAGARALLRGRRPARGAANGIFWALKDVSLEIPRGQVVGIIGANGAGKSTLLKVLSRITEPSSGRALIYGSVASLLEVGIGFDRELTGRENVYLNGAILGMRKAEIDRQLDEIVAFAEVDRFLDTPVKRYSSGMYVRLAFAVAAHLRPEILIVDEVLAVGDTRFQKKCLNKMRDVGHDGRTVLFVSHNMAAITSLCQRAVLVAGGHIALDGPAHDVVAAYMSAEIETMAVREWRDDEPAPGGDVARLRAVRVRAADGTITEAIDIRQPVRVEIEYEVIAPGRVLLPNAWFFNEQGVCLFGAQDRDPAWRMRPRPAGCYVSTVWIPGNLLSDGRVSVCVYLCTLHPLTREYTGLQFGVEHVVSFCVVDTIDRNASRGDWLGPMAGAVRPMLEWTTEVDLPAGVQAMA
jgi:lipopolysaccharide transport system ATP-binding protein